MSRENALKRLPAIATGSNLELERLLRDMLDGRAGVLGPASSQSAIDAVMEAWAAALPTSAPTGAGWWLDSGVLTWKAS